MNTKMEGQTLSTVQPAPHHSGTVGSRHEVIDSSPAAWEAEADQHRLQLALRAGNVFTWEIDLAADRLTCSPNVVDILGFSLGTTPSSAAERVHPDDRSALRQHFQRAQTHGDPLDFEFRLVHPESGESRWVRMQGARISPDGAPLGVIGACQHMSERKRAELRTAFLVDVEQDLLTLAEIDAILRTVGEKTAHTFDLDHLTFTTFDADEATLIFSRNAHPDKRFPAARHLAGSDDEASVINRLRSGRTVMLDDVPPGPAAVANGASPNCAAGFPGILVPYADRGSLKFVIGAYRLAARDWRGDEIDTLRELAARVYHRIDRLQSDEAHRAAEARYRALFESIDEGFCVIEMLFDDDGTPVDYRFLEVNPAFERQTGLREVEGKRILELAPTHEAYWFEIYGRVATSGESVSFEQEATAIGGRWFEVDAARLGDPENRHVAVIFRDITERKRSDDAVRESEARLRRAIAIETVGVVFFRKDGVLTYANDAFLRMSGYDAADIASGEVRWDTITPPDWMPRTREANAEFAATGRMAPFEKEYLHKDGTRWWSLCAATRLNEREGVKFIIDITGSKRSTAEQARMAAMVDSSRDAFIGTDMDGVILSWNPAATKLFGYTAAEAVGQNVSILVSPDQADERKSLLDQLHRGEDPSPLETQRLRKDGSLVDVEIRPSLIRDASGQYAGIAVVASDVTERKRLERAQDDFLAMASHDLRSPVTVLRGRAQMMKRRKTYDETGINVILDQTRRIERLTDDLQDLVRLEAGKVEIVMTRINLGELAKEAADRLRIQHHARRIQVIAPDPPVIGQWDRDRIGQILDNLLENAAKYANGESKIVVTVTGTRSEARVSIADQGPGIPPEAASRLFERFYRVDDTGATAGLGLGLYIARMLAEAQGGRIWVDSELGQGSTFTVALPLAP